jgi:hypothetical protein
MSKSDRLSTAITLGIFAYLGFYVFGLVMGVYSPGDVPYFTIPALVFVAIVVVREIVSRLRRTDEDASLADDRLNHERRHWRETRGF